MTVWAYRDGILASDSLVVTERMKTGSTRKVTKSGSGWLAGGAGNATDMAQFLRWVEEGREEDDATKLENLEGFLVSPKGKTFLVEADLHPFPIEAEFHAGGSGCAVAIGAMEAGATAEEAVRIAIKHVTSCGGEIQVVKLKGS